MFKQLFKISLGVQVKAVWVRLELSAKRSECPILGKWLILRQSSGDLLSQPGVWIGV
jgi:hypothetical protein